LEVGVDGGGVSARSAAELGEVPFALGGGLGVIGGVGVEAGGGEGVDGGGGVIQLGEEDGGVEEPSAGGAVELFGGGEVVAGGGESAEECLVGVGGGVGAERGRNLYPTACF
jgi:hypothetical protein